MKRIESLLTSNKTLKEILVESKDLLSEESRWAKEAPALQEDSTRAKPVGDEAVAWCLVGAVAKSCNDEGICPPALLKYLDFAVEEYTEGRYDNAEEFNDIADHNQLMQFFDVAIDLAP